MSKQAYKFRLYPTRKQLARLQETLDACRTLYNAAVTERRDAYLFHVRQHPNYYDEPTRLARSSEIGINYYSQATQLPEIKDLREDYHEIHSQVLQDVLRRVQKAFDAFSGGARTVRTLAIRAFKARAAMTASPIRKVALPLPTRSV